MLFRALTEVEPYRAALAARAASRRTSWWARGFFAHDQVADTLLALVEPARRAALRSGAGLPLRIGRRRGPGRAAAGGEAAGRRPRWPAPGGRCCPPRAGSTTRPAVEAAEALQPHLRDRGLAGLVEAAIDARGYDLAVLGLPDGARRHANLRKLVRMAQDFSAVRGPDLRGFLGLLRRMAEAGDRDPGEATLVDPDLDAVRLATVHAVKGQEFPAMVMADASHGLPPVLPHGPRRARRERRDPGLPRRGRQCRARLRLREAAGRRRRRGAPRDLRGGHPGRAPPGSRRPLDRAATSRTRRSRSCARPSGSPEVRVPARRAGSPWSSARSPPPQATGGGRGSSPSRPRLRPPPAPARPEADPVAGRRLSFTALAALAVAGGASPGVRAGSARAARGSRGRTRRPASAPTAWGGTAFGDLVHRFLAALDWGAPPPAPGWAATAARAGGLLDSAVDQERAERLVEGLLRSPVADRIRAGRRLAEEPFAVEVGGAVLGAIDLLVDEGTAAPWWSTGRRHVLSAGLSAADVAAEYRLQQALYGLAALRAGWREVELAWLLLEDVAGSPSRTVRQADDADLEAEVADGLAPLRVPERPSAATTPSPSAAAARGSTRCVWWRSPDLWDDRAPFHPGRGSGRVGHLPQRRGGAHGERPAGASCCRAIWTWRMPRPSTACWRGSPATRPRARCSSTCASWSSSTPMASGPSSAPATTPSGPEAGSRSARATGRCAARSTSWTRTARSTSSPSRPTTPGERGPLPVARERRLGAALAAAVGPRPRHPAAGARRGR